VAESTLFELAFLKGGARRKVEMPLSVFSGLACDSNHRRVGATISVFSQLLL